MKTVMLRGVEVGAGMPKIIVPIVANTAEGILAKAEEFLNYEFDVVEWRVDFYDDVFDTEKVLRTLKALNEKLGDTVFIQRVYFIPYNSRVLKSLFLNGMFKLIF